MPGLGPRNALGLVSLYSHVVHTGKCLSAERMGSFCIVTSPVSQGCDSPRAKWEIMQVSLIVVYYLYYSSKHLLVVCKAVPYVGDHVAVSIKQKLWVHGFDILIINNSFYAMRI